MSQRWNSENDTRRTCPESGGIDEPGGFWRCHSERDSGQEQLQANDSSGRACGKVLNSSNVIDLLGRVKFAARASPSFCPEWTPFRFPPSRLWT